MDLKPYEEYDNIVLPWLQRLPSHWILVRNKRVMHLRKDTVGQSHGEYSLLSLTKQGVIPRDLENAKGKFPKEFDTYQTVQPNDMIFCLFDIDETPRTVGLSSLKGMITGAYTVFRPQNINNKYLFYYYLSLDDNKQLKPLYTGLRKVINTDTFLNTKMPYPPIEEQDQIVKYLDGQVYKINKYIRAKKKQIAMMKEQKQVIISEAVTKGIHPNADMKDSGIKWIGEIPKSFHVRSFYKVATVRSNLVHPEDYMEYKQVSPSNIEKNTGNLLPCKTVQDVGIISDNHLFYKGQILYSKIRPLLNKVTIAPFDGLCSADMYPVETKLETKYLMYFMLSHTFLSQLSMSGNRVKMPKINREELSNVLVAFPSDIEQKNIVEHIEMKLKKIDDCILENETKVNLFEEYRTRLISDVVTGKVDVRNIEITEIAPNQMDETLEVNTDCENDSVEDIETE